MTFARSVRLAARRVERQAPRQFAELVALIGGLLVGAPQVLAAFDNHRAAALLSLMLVQWCAAALLWWIATRRRKIRTPLRFGGWALLIALGRHGDRRRPPVALKAKAY